MVTYPRARSLRRAWFIVPALVLLLSLVPLSDADGARRRAGQASAQQAIAWLRDQQNPDGSFAAFGGDGDASSTANAILAFAAAGVDPATVVSTDGVSATAYVEAHAAALGR